MEALGWYTVCKRDEALVALRAERSDSHITVLVTDLSKLWCERQSTQEIRSILQKLNPLLETSPIRVIYHLYHLLNDNSNIVDVQNNGPILLINIKSRLDNLPFVWEFTLTLESSEKFQQYVTHPLLAMLKESANIQEELCAVIRNKEREIDDYKASGATVSRKQLLTEEFNKNRYYHERRWRSIVDSVKRDPVELFCSTTAESNGLYGEIVKEIADKEQLTITERSDSVASNLTPLDDTNKELVKEAELNRTKEIKKRLMDEEQNQLLKLAQKKKPKLI